MGAKAWLRAEALRRIDQLPDNAWRKFLLGDFVLSYLPLEGDEQNEYDRLLSTAPYQGARTMAVSIVDQAIEKGILEGKRTLLLRQLAKQYGGRASRFGCGCRR